MFIGIGINIIRLERYPSGPPPPVVIYSLDFSEDRNSMYIALL